jgi:DNA-binding MarR family transcriptional regulator
MKKTMANLNPAEPVFRTLLRIIGLLRQGMEPHFARLGISGAQWGVLRVLSGAQAEAPEGLRLTDLGERLLIRPPSVTGVVDRLERQGLVKRNESHTDQRVRRVGLTAAGRAAVKRIQGVHSQHISRLFAGLTPPELERLGRLLGKLEISLGRIESAWTSSEVCLDGEPRAEGREDRQHGR